MAGRLGGCTMVVPRVHSLRPCVFADLNKSGSKGAFRLVGVTWDHFCCNVEPSPGHIRCRKKSFRDSWVIWHSSDMS